MKRFLGVIVLFLGMVLLVGCTEKRANPTFRGVGTITLEVGDVFDAEYRVKATDADGVDLTADIVITENTVNTTAIGNYQVIYEVTDSKDKKTTVTRKVIITDDLFKDQKVVLITDIGNIDDKSFNQGAYEGIVAFDKKYPTLDFAYLKPAEQTDAEYITAIEQAIQDGATVIVTPGYLFNPAINVTQKEYPDVKFIILDGSPADVEGGTLEDNVYAVFYAEEQSGFLAGYAAVMDGYRHLGFMGGMAVPAVQRFGHGYVQGAAVAAKELDLADNAITIEYLYTGGFEANPDVQAAATGLYNKGVEVIFACGGAVGQSVMAAAEAHDGDKKVIGVDIDQSGDSDTVITSATKNLSASVEQALESIFVTKEWYYEFGGTTVSLKAEHDGVNLPMATSKFTTFTQAQYDSVFAKLVNKTITVNDKIGAFGDDGNAAKEFETDEVKVVVIPYGV